MTPVATSLRFRDITTGVKRTCALDFDGALYCWGRGAEGPPDDRCLDSNGVANTNDCTTRPVPVHQGARFLTVAIGASHQCGVTTSGVTVCWGANESGQVGDGTLTSTNRLTLVRTGGVTEREIVILDAKARITWWLAHGGVGLAGVLVLLLGGRGWVASQQGKRLAAFVIGGLALWALSFGLSTGPSGSGDVAYGLAMMALIASGAIALVLSAIAAGMSVVTLRRQRDATYARIALVLAVLTLVAGVGLALWIFWPSER